LDPNVAKCAAAKSRLGDRLFDRCLQGCCGTAFRSQWGNFSAILADVMLPGLDGFGFIRAIRNVSRFAELCLIAVTALAMATDREKGIAACFTDYLVKPITPDDIKAVLWRYLPHARKAPV